jgi:hypothetical protein
VFVASLEIVFRYYGVPLKYRIRVAGVDCPESRTRDLEEKKHGLACKKAVYQNRMQQKFPGWRVINPVVLLPSAHAPPLPSPPSPPLAPSYLRLKPSEPQSPDKEEHVP